MSMSVNRAVAIAAATDETGLRSSYERAVFHGAANTLCRRGVEALKRLQAGEWPAPSTVIDLYTSWTAAVADAVGDA